MRTLDAMASYLAGAAVTLQLFEQAYADVVGDIEKVGSDWARRDAAQAAAPEELLAGSATKSAFVRWVLERLRGTHATSQALWEKKRWSSHLAARWVPVGHPGRDRGTGPARPTSRARRVTSNVITVLLLLVAVGLLLRRFGVLHR